MNIKVAESALEERQASLGGSGPGKGEAFSVESSAERKEVFGRGLQTHLDPMTEVP